MSVLSTLKGLVTFTLERNSTYDQTLGKLNFSIYCSTDSSLARSVKLKATLGDYKFKPNINTKRQLSQSLKSNKWD